MIITLYKNCIFNTNYNEVYYCKLFKNKIPRDEYLNSLQKITFEIEDTFLEYNGHININYSDIDYNGTIFEFNYMKIQNNINVNNGFIGFYFIKDIEMRNDLAVLDYSIDVWHTFSSTMNIYNSSLSNCKLINGYNNNFISFHKLPNDYYSNDVIGINRLFEVPRIYENKYRIIISYQIYNTVVEGQTGQRLSRTSYLYDNHNQKSYFNYEEAIELINYLLYARSVSDGRNDNKGLFLNQYDNDIFGILSATARLFFDIAHIYIIPAVFPIAFDDDITTYEGRIGKFVSASAGYSNFDDIYLLKIDEMKNELNSIKSGEIENNFRNLRIGTLYENYEIENNGTSLSYIVSFNFNEFSASIQLGIEDKIYDFTSSFEFNIPYDSITGAENQQRNISRNFAMMNSLAKIGSSAVSLGTMSEVGFDLVGSSVRKQKINYGKGKRQLKKTSSTTTSKKGSYSYMDAFDSGNELLNGTMDFIDKILPYHTTNSPLTVENDCFLNANYTFCIFVIRNIDNEEYVNKLIEEVGYIVAYIGGNEIIDDLDENNQNVVNAIKFDFIKLYGKFPQIVADKLSDILLNGVKIHYE